MVFRNIFQPYFLLVKINYKSKAICCDRCIIEVCRFLKLLHFTPVISLKTILYYANLSTNSSLDQQQELHWDPKYSHLNLRKSKYLVILLALSIVRSRQCLESEFRAMSGCLDASVTMSVAVSVVSDWMLV